MTDEQNVETSAEEQGAAVAGSDGTEQGAASGKSRKGLLIGILIAVIIAAAAAAFLYVKFFIPREIHMSESTLDLYVGDTARLSYEILPESADNLEVVWATSNEHIAMIDEFGVVTAISGGRCAVAVATGNGKTDTCIVTVTDPAQVQKESLNTVRSFIDSQATVTEGSMNVLTVREIDDTHSFLIGTEGEDLLLISRAVGQLDEMGVDAQYSTLVRLEPENIDSAQVVQNNRLTVYDFPIEMNAEGLVRLASYQYGDEVALSSTGSTIDGLDASDALHEMADSGVTTCISEFSQFLSSQDYGFTLSDFGLSLFSELSGDGGEEPEAAVIGEPVDSEYSQVETVPVETESVLSDSADDAEESVNGMAETGPSSETGSDAEERAETDAVTDEEDTVSGAAGALFSSDAAAEDASTSTLSKFPTASPSAAALSSITEGSESETSGAPVLIIAL